MSAHTPGPWKVKDTLFCDSVLGPQNQRVAIATCDDGNNPPPVWRANALLIAAAPDLLAACKMALRELAGQNLMGGCCQCGTEEPGRHEGQCITVLLRAAIAKARGEESHEEEHDRNDAARTRRSDDQDYEAAIGEPQED